MKWNRKMEKLCAKFGAQKRAAAAVDRLNRELAGGELKPLDLKSETPKATEAKR